MLIDAVVESYKFKIHTCFCVEIRAEKRVMSQWPQEQYLMYKCNVLNAPK